MDSDKAHSASEERRKAWVEKVNNQDLIVRLIKNVFQLEDRLQREAASYSAIVVRNEASLELIQKQEDRIQLLTAEVNRWRQRANQYSDKASKYDALISIKKQRKEKERQTNRRKKNKVHFLLGKSKFACVPNAHKTFTADMRGTQLKNKVTCFLCCDALKIKRPVL